MAIANKAVRSYLEAMVLERKAPPAGVVVAAAVRARVRIRLEIEPVTAIRTTARVWTGAAVVSRLTLRVGPRPA